MMCVRVRVLKLLMQISAVKVDCGRIRPKIFQ
jgi:hypothetical protein